MQLNASEVNDGLRVSNDHEWNYQVKVDERLSGRMIRSILQSELRASRRLLQQLVQHNGVYRNGEPVFLTRRANLGDEIYIMLPNEQSDIPPEEMELDIRYEDEEILVINKPPGMLTHPSAKERAGSLLAGVRSLLERKSARHTAPHAVHRLDRDTSGLILIAKHAHAHHLYDEALRAGEIHRTYCALAQGSPTPWMRNGSTPTGEGWQAIDLPIAQDPQRPSRRVISAAGQRAVTHYRVLRKHGDVALVEIVLETGRTHQIRIHFSAAGMPLTGDPDYGRRVRPATRGGDLAPAAPQASPIHRQALHAIQLGWIHPVHRQWHVVSALPPADITATWRRLGGADNDWLEAMKEDAFRQIDMIR